MRVRVETNETSAGEIPERIHFNGRCVKIAEMLDQWHGEEERYFKLRGGDGNLYMLRFDEMAKKWDLTMYKSRRAEDVALPSDAEEPGWKRRAGLAETRARRHH
jgi:hypothetical protein